MKTEPKTRDKNKENKGKLSDKVVEYILECEDKTLSSLSVAGIAAIFGVSDSFLARKFKKDKCFSVGKFIFRERMARAASLLTQEPDLSIKQLAEMMGYFDYDYFIHIFKQYYGVTPNRYRGCKEKYKS